MTVPLCVSYDHAKLRLLLLQAPGAEYTYGLCAAGAVGNALLRALPDPRVNIAGIRRAGLLALLDALSPARLSRQLRRLRDIGVIKRVTGTHRYDRARIGRSVTTALCHARFDDVFLT